MASLKDTKLTITKGQRFSHVKIAFNVSIDKEEFGWLAKRNPAEVQAICALYGKDTQEGGKDKILYSFNYDLDQLEGFKGAKEAITGSLPVNVEFKVLSDKLDEDKPTTSIADRGGKGIKPNSKPHTLNKLKQDIDDVYAVVYLSLQKGEGEAWEAITSAAASNVVSKRF